MLSTTVLSHISIITFQAIFFLHTQATYPKQQLFWSACVSWLLHITHQSLGFRSNFNLSQNVLLLHFRNIALDLPFLRSFLESKIVTPFSEFPQYVALILLYCKSALGFPSGSVIKNLPAKGGGMSLIPGSGRSPGEGNGNPLQYSCPGNPVYRGAWQTIVHGVLKELYMISGPNNDKFNFALRLTSSILFCQVSVSASGPKLQISINYSRKKVHNFKMNIKTNFLVVVVQGLQ